MTNQPEAPGPADAEAALSTAVQSLASALTAARERARIAQDTVRQVGEITAGTATARDSLLITGKRLSRAGQELDEITDQATRMTARLDQLTGNAEEDGS